MRVLLHLQDLAFPGATVTWWKDSRRMQVLLEAIRDAGIDPSHWGGAGGPLQPTGTAGELLKRAASWKRGSYRLAAEGSAEPAAYADLGLLPQGVDLRVVDDTEPGEADVLGRLIRLAIRLHEDYGEDAVLGPIAEVDLPLEDYPRPRPPRSHRHFRPGTLATFVDRRFPYPDAGALQALLAAEPPERAERSEHGSLVVFRWIDDLGDPVRVAEARTRQEQWLAEVLQPPVESGYNERGDQQVVPATSDAHPPLTVYDGFSGDGYKAMVPGAGGKLEEEVGAQIRQWIAAGELPDGTPVRRLHLIVPNRETAVRVRDEARSLGVRGVYYMDDEGRMWNPFPAGAWA